MTLADLIATTLGICDDCRMAVYPEDATESDQISGQLWHADCPTFAASHRPAPRVGMVEQLREVDAEAWR